MGDITIPIWLPAAPEVFGVFLVLFAVYCVYKVAKFIISIWTGA